ncbi:MAG: multicopper oxidase domain-containing protein [Acidimicrobiales bacterium]
MSRSPFGRVVLALLAAVLFAIACSPDDELLGEVDAGDLPSDAIVPLIDLSEFAIRGDLTVPEGHVVADVLNQGAAVHNLRLAGGPITADLNGGEGSLLDLGNLAPGTYELFCEIPGHRSSGMEATLTVVPPADADMAKISTERSQENNDWAQLDATMINSIKAFPATTEGSGNEPLEPKILADGTKEFDLTVEITPWEVEPGKVVQAWTYNGTVPGPEIRVDVGDKVKVNVHNKLPMGTDIHWHGISTPNDQDGVSPITQSLIESGDDYTYEFVAERVSVGMYHAHHHGHSQIPNGLFGVFLIGDVAIPRGQTIGGITVPEDVVIDREIPMVLNDAGVIGYSLNGKSVPATEPYVVDGEEWILVTYYNEGLQIHPMHLHQFPQIVIAKDGFTLDNPYVADTVNVAPGERYTVLINPNREGTWVWHCHILTHVEKDEGMFGMVTAIVVT